MSIPQSGGGQIENMNQLSENGELAQSMKNLDLIKVL